MSGSPYIGYFVSIFVRAPELWDAPRHGQGGADQLRRAGRAVAQSRDARRARALPLRRARQGVLRRARQGRRRAAVHARSSASRCRTSSSRCAAGSRATSCPTPIAPAASSSPATPRISIIRPPGSGSIPGSATPSISAGSSRRRSRAGAAAALLDSYEIERQPVGRRNIGHADVSHANDREQEPAAGDLRGHARRRTRPPQDGRRDRRRADQEIHHRRARARLPLRSLADLLARGSAGAAQARSTDYHPTALHRQPRAACLARRGPLDHRSVRPRLHADALRRRGARRVTDRARRSPQRGVPLTVETIADPDIGALYERRLVLVRPDGHVAWRARRSCRADPLALADRVRGAVPRA